MRKITIEFIRSEFAKEGYELLTKVYENNQQKLNYICPKGHKYSVGWGSWRQGQRCPECAGNIKLPIEFIRSEFAKEGYKLLSKVYNNNVQKLDYICLKGHRRSISWGSWRRGRRCPKCSIIERAKRSRIDIEFIRSEFVKEGYTLLTEVYENARQKLNYICPKGHRRSISWGSWRRGRRCPKCSVIERAKKLRIDIEFIRSEFVKEGYELLTIVHENAHQKLYYICSKGHKHSIRWNDWQRGNRCPYCAGNGKPTIEFIRAEFTKEGYELLTKVYENNQQKLNYICPKGHRHSITWNNWQRGHRCPYCKANVSKWEKEIKKYIKGQNIAYIPNDRTQLLNPKTGCFLELDIWFPDLNKAVECNGVYWHSKERAIKNDKIKKQLCKDQRIDLLIITDKEWKDDIDKCKNKIKNFFEFENKT